MKKLTRQEKHEQCMREIRGTLIVVLICCAWHIASAFLLNGTGLYFLGMPAWFSVSTFGTIILSLIGVWYLLKPVSYTHLDVYKRQPFNRSSTDNSCS